MINDLNLRLPIQPIRAIRTKELAKAFNISLKTVKHFFSFTPTTGGIVLFGLYICPCLIFNKLLMHVTYGCGSILFLRYVMYFRFYG